MARIDKLKKYEDQIQIVIQRLDIDIPKLNCQNGTATQIIGKLQHMTRA